MLTPSSNKPVVVVSQKAFTTPVTIVSQPDPFAVFRVVQADLAITWITGITGLGMQGVRVELCSADH